MRALCLVAVCLFARPSFAQPVTATAVNEAIDRAVDFLRQSQVVRTGKWPGHEDNGCGQSALVVLALLNAGLPTDDRTVESGLDYLVETSPSKTYEVALQTMAFAAADPQKYARQIRRNVEWLERAQVKNGQDKGGWGTTATVAVPIRLMPNSASWRCGKLSERNSPNPRTR